LTKLAGIYTFTVQVIDDFVFALAIIHMDANDVTCVFRLGQITLFEVPFDRMTTEPSCGCEECKSCTPSCCLFGLAVRLDSLITIGVPVV
jgi:hypothetical protein